MELYPSRRLENKAEDSCNNNCQGVEGDWRGGSLRREGHCEVLYWQEELTDIGRNETDSIYSNDIRYFYLTSSS